MKGRFVCSKGGCLTVPNVPEDVASFAKVGLGLCGCYVHCVGNGFVGVSTQPERGGGG